MNTTQNNTHNGDIFLVDDNPDNLRLLSKLLIDNNYKIRTALNGKMAIMSATALPPDLILLDINMPDFNGYQVCEKLKQDQKTAAIPIIFISALDDVLDKVKGFQVGGVDYITKPFQAEEVLMRIKTHLTLRKLQQKIQDKNEQLQREILYRKEIEKALKMEKNKTEILLFNILPKKIAHKLKNSHNSIAENFEEVTIIFADLVNFTSYSSNIEPKDLISLLNQIFSTFDKIAEYHGIEKIKTIGDAYMGVAGLPNLKDNHGEMVANFALDIQKSISNFKRNENQSFQLRIGINTGSVIAGVIGMKKFSYDLWGDSVNVASRMESSGEAGKIQVSETTFEKLKHQYIFEKRGNISIKGKGEMTTYWLLDKL